MRNLSVILWLTGFLLHSLSFPDHASEDRKCDYIKTHKSQDQIPNIANSNELIYSDIKYGLKAGAVIYLGIAAHGTYHLWQWMDQDEGEEGKFNGFMYLSKKERAQRILQDYVKGFPYLDLPAITICLLGGIAAKMTLTLGRMSIAVARNYYFRHSHKCSLNSTEN